MRIDVECPCLLFRHRIETYSSQFVVLIERKLVSGEANGHLEVVRTASKACHLVRVAIVVAGGEVALRSVPFHKGLSLIALTGEEAVGGMGVELGEGDGCSVGSFALNVGTVFFAVGFSVMMVLDVALG